MQSMKSRILRDEDSLNFLSRWKQIWVYRAVLLGNWAAGAAKSLQSCPTLCDPIGSSPPGSRVPGILQGLRGLVGCRPWGSPGKNTGVGCHVLLQCMKVKSEREIAQLCPTLRDPMDCSLPGSSVHGICQARVLEWGAIAFSGELGYHMINLS